MTDITSQVKNYKGSNSFVLKMKDAISKYGSLTVNQKSAVEKIGEMEFWVPKSKIEKWEGDNDILLKMF